MCCWEFMMEIIPKSCLIVKLMKDTMEVHGNFGRDAVWGNLWTTIFHTLYKSWLMVVAASCYRVLYSPQQERGSWKLVRFDERIDEDKHRAILEKQKKKKWLEKILRLDCGLPLSRNITTMKQFGSNHKHILKWSNSTELEKFPLLTLQSSMTKPELFCMKGCLKNVKSLLCKAGRDVPLKE